MKLSFRQSIALAGLTFGSLAFSTTTIAQVCATPSPIVQWDISTCAPNGDYSEFIPTATTAACPSMTASNIHRNNGSHSCNPGHPNGDGYAFCMPNFNGAVWQDNAPYAIRFNVNFGPQDQGVLSHFSFWQTASNPSLFMGGGWTNNNYPTQYGFRVLKNGIEIYQSIDVPTTQTWSQQHFDFAGLSDFTYTGNTTFEFELLAYNPIGNGYSMNIWDVDQFSLDGCCADCPGLNFQPVITDVTCNGDADGSILLSTNGGTPPYTIDWSNQQTGALNDNIGVGFYTATVTDAAGCPGSATYYINEPTALEVTATDDAVDCKGDSDGQSTATATGGTSPYTYAWSDGQTTATATNLSANAYTVTVTDANGCSDIAAAAVTEPSILVPITSSGPSYCGDTTGFASVAVSGGTGPYTYYWSNGETTATITGLVGGGAPYTVYVHDANGCTTSATVTVADNSPIIVCTIVPGEFRTQTQGGWGANPNGNNPGVYVQANFATAFPSGLTIGCNNTLTLTSSSAVAAYLPCGGPSAMLTQNYTDPSCIGNTLVSQLIAATLSVGFDANDPAFGSASINLSQLIVASGPMAGLSVAQVLTEANNAIGGCGSAYSLGDLNSTLTDINENFVDGTIALNGLVCPMGCPTFAPDPSGSGSGYNTSAMSVWPNPSHEEMVNIKVEVEKAGQGSLTIYDVYGKQKVLNQPLGDIDAGTFIYTWDGCRNASGEEQPGLYLIEVRVGDKVYSTRILRM